MLRFLYKARFMFYVAFLYFFLRLLKLLPEKQSLNRGGIEKNCGDVLGNTEQTFTC